MDEFNWTQEQMLEIELKEPDDFLKIRETLSRIGVASRKDRKLYQSCHILHKHTSFSVFIVCGGCHRTSAELYLVKKPFV